MWRRVADYTTSCDWKARSPTVISRVRRTTNNDDDDERRQCRLDSATRWMWSERYRGARPSCLGQMRKLCLGLHWWSHLAKGIVPEGIKLVRYLNLDIEMAIDVYLYLYTVLRFTVLETVGPCYPAAIGEVGFSSARLRTYVRVCVCVCM